MLAMPAPGCICTCRPGIAFSHIPFSAAAKRHPDAALGAGHQCHLLRRCGSGHRQGGRERRRHQG